VSNVITMTQMFEKASSFDQDLSGWNTKSIMVYTDMFKDCPLENQPEKQPIFK